MSLITLTTDFGVDSPYVAQMKGAVLSVAASVNIVDVTHSVCAQDVLHGALVLADTAFVFPEGTIHVAVVDPGVGSERMIVAAKVEGHWFVAPDNGLLTGVTHGRSVESLWKVTNRDLWRPHVSSTFHGRDIMGPVAAHLSLGVSPNLIGPPLEDITRLRWPECRADGNGLIGEVVVVDSFGNLLTNISRSDVEAIQSDGNWQVTCGNIVIDGIATHYASGKGGDVISLFGSSNRLEIAVVNENAASRLNLGRGQSVELRPLA